MQTIEKQILTKIKKARSGTLFFTDSFTSSGKPDAVRQALQRLVKSGEIERVADGIFCRPRESKIAGKIMPTTEDIAVAIARREKARIVPTGSYAQYKLGLSTQVPMNIVYYTDTTARVIKIDKRTIKFKKASSRNLAYRGKISMLAIQALRTIGKESVYDDEVEHIKRILQNENPKHLQHDLSLAPAWIRNLLTPKNEKR
jgi:hypothetical protein